MDVKEYYRKIRELESTLSGDVVIVSLDTPDGGREGVASEVSAPIAAKLIVESRARVATEQEAARYRKESREASVRAQELAEAGKVRLAIVDEVARRPRRSSKTDKE